MANDTSGGEPALSPGSCFAGLTAARHAAALAGVLLNRFAYEGQHVCLLDPGRFLGLQTDCYQRAVASLHDLDLLTNQGLTAPLRMQYVQSTLQRAIDRF